MERRASEKYKQSIRKFEDIRLELETSNSKTFQTRFDRFVYFCENDEILKVISSRLKENPNANFDDWWEKGQKTGGQMIGSKEFSLPFDEDERDAILYQLVLKIFEKKITLSRFCMDFFGTTNLNIMVYDFIGAVLEPLNRSIRYQLEEFPLESEQQVGNESKQILHEVSKNKENAAGLLKVKEIDEIVARTDIGKKALSLIIQIADKINKYGYEGKRVGSSFVIGDYSEVEKYISKNPTNPFKEIERSIFDNKTIEYVERYATLDGAIILSGDGIVKEAGALISADVRSIDVTGGARHKFAAAITKITKSISIVVSQSGGIKIYKNGQEIKNIIK